MSFVFMTSDGTVNLNTRNPRKNVRVCGLRLDIVCTHVSSHEYDGKQQPKTIWKLDFSLYCGVHLRRRKFLRIFFVTALLSANCKAFSIIVSVRLPKVTPFK
jgi:hypothetical protein